MTMKCFSKLQGQLALRCVISSALLVFGLRASVAQNLMVKSAEFNPKDLYASTNPVLDKKGQPCALLRFSIPSVKGVSFSEEAIKTSYEDGEYSVFAPAGTKHITVKHPNYKPLKIKMKDLGLTLERKGVYAFAITPDESVRQIFPIKEKKMQYVSIHVSPSFAAVTINGEKLQAKRGQITKLLPIGSYSYTVSAKDYNETNGTFTLEKKSALIAFDVKLVPTFGWISIESNGESEAAVVALDGKQIGVLPIWRTDRIPSGSHKLSINKEFYKPYENTVTVSDGKVTKLSPKLEINYSDVTLQVPKDVEVWVNGVLKGMGTWTGRMLSGSYEIETRKLHHRSQKESVTIYPSYNDRVIVLKEPTPIYGSINVNSSPEGADIYIDGGFVGVTPMLVENILVGQHEIQFVKDGYITPSETINVEEELKIEINKKLSVSLDDVRRK